jgi:hypothetical protein
MNITLKAKELDQLKELPGVERFISYHSYNAERKMKIDVASLTEPQLKKVEHVLQKNPTLNRCPLDVIQQWRKIKSNPNDQRPRTLEQFATILKTYIATVPKYTLFQQTEDEDWLPYLVGAIGYTPPKKTSHGVQPGCVWMRLYKYIKGKKESENVYFYKTDIEKKSCSEIMDKSGYMIATDDMFKRHAEEVERFKIYQALLGKQVLGTGSAEVIGSEASWWGGKQTPTSNVELEVDGRKSRLVIDLYQEEDDDNRRSSRGEDAELPLIDGSFWKIKGTIASDDDELEVDETTELQLEVPLHPYILCFNLEKHHQCWVHVNRLEDYIYDTDMGSKLVLPEYQKELLEIMVQHDLAEFKDIIQGKSGGSIVLCSGCPGTGKTLTAEVFAEAIERPLYIIQSSQLGTNAKELEGELVKILDRASRWGAILLIDEADVFIHERGDDIEQNAIVGIFLRVLEYYQGILFMTTNRDTIIDDAVISRCTANVKYNIPDIESQIRIWKILAKLSKIEIKDSEIAKFAKDHPKLSGRDVKGLLKLANLVATRRQEKITNKLIEYVMQFKPTMESVK